MDRTKDSAERRDRWSIPTRRAALLGLPLFLAGCAAGGRLETVEIRSRLPSFGRDDGLAADWERIYAGFWDGQFEIEPLDFAEIDQTYLRHWVRYDGPEIPGTLVVDPRERFLYLVQEGGRAIRYGVGVGREGFAWSGRATVGRKAAWPRWTPPHEMTLRDPEAAKWAAGMPGGPENPLGARALYLYQGNRDTLYRIHGNNDPSSIGTAVSSGCIRMLNQDVIDLHRRVPVGAPVVVLG